jgi:hypothetical protein
MPHYYLGETIVYDSSESHVRASIHEGFPVIVDDMLLGYITRESLTRAIGELIYLLCAQFIRLPFRTSSHWPNVGRGDGRW